MVHAMRDQRISFCVCKNLYLAQFLLLEWVLPLNRTYLMIIIDLLPLVPHCFNFPFIYFCVIS